MVKHYNPSIVENALRILRTKGDNLSDEVAGPVAVINLEPVCNIVKSVGATTTGNITLYTTPIDKDFYLTGCSLAFSKNATCDIASGPIRLAIVVDNVTTYVINFAVQTLTAESNHANVEFAVPIKLDRGSVIVTTNAFTAGALVRQVTCRGYTQETTAN